MTPKEFIIRLYDCDKHTKIVLNHGHFEPIEMLLFMVDDAPTVEEVFKTFLDYENLFEDKGHVKMRGGYVVDIVYHWNHYKKNRFYEIVVEE